MNTFVKSHGLGNDYIVLDSENINFELNKEKIITLCDVHYGIGSDGILLKVPSKVADFGLVIYNPDSSEAEKSGNGLRIFSKFLYDYKFTGNKDFSIETKGGIVSAHVIEETNGKAQKIKVDMGKAIFNAREIPVAADEDLYFDKKLTLNNRDYLINCVSVGNPHCVILKDILDVEEIKEHGKNIECASIFPNKINVQFVKIISENEAEILIWERGAGYTLASGSSSCAVASVLKKKGLIKNNVNIKMPGGTLEIEIDDSWNIRMSGEVQEIAHGTLSWETVA